MVLSRHLTVAIAILTGVASTVAPLAAQQSAPPRLVAPAAPPAPEATVSEDYVIGPEDVLGVVFWREPEMSGDVIVRPDGRITLPLLGEIKAQGLKPQALRDQVKDAAGRFLTDANVTVVVRQVNSRKIYVTGQVLHPGVFSLASPHTVLQAIGMAGGLNEYADGDNITIARSEQGRTKIFKFNYKNVSKGRALEQNIQLQPGDTVMVP